MTVNWEGEYQHLLSLVVDAMKVPNEPQATHDALLRLAEYVEAVEVHMLEVATGWTDEDQRRWDDAAYAAESDFPS